MICIFHQDYKWTKFVRRQGKMCLLSFKFFDKVLKLLGKIGRLSLDFWQSISFKQGLKSRSVRLVGCQTITLLVCIVVPTLGMDQYHPYLRKGVRESGGCGRRRWQHVLKEEVTWWTAFSNCFHPLVFREVKSFVPWNQTGI